MAGVGVAGTGDGRGESPSAAKAGATIANAEKTAKDAVKEPPKPIASTVTRPDPVKTATRPDERRKLHMPTVVRDVANRPDPKKQEPKKEALTKKPEPDDRRRHCNPRPKRSKGSGGGGKGWRPWC